MFFGLETVDIPRFSTMGEPQNTFTLKTGKILLKCNAETDNFVNFDIGLVVLEILRKVETFRYLYNSFMSLR